MKKCKMKKIVLIASVIFGVVLFSNVSLAESKDGSDEVYESLLTKNAEEVVSNDNIRYPYGVTSDMTKSDYWKNLATNSGKVLMSKDEIVSLNQKIVNEEETNVVDLEKIENPIDGNIDTFMKNGELRQLYIDGQPINQQEYLDKFEAGNSSVDSVIYAIVVKRADIKCWPTNDVIGYSATDADDEAQLDSLNVNEPVVILDKCIVDGEVFFYCQARAYLGWINEKNLAIFDSKQDWVDSWKFDINDKDILVVTESKITLEPSIQVPSTSEVQLMLGTVLKLVPETELPVSIGERGTWYNYVVYLPTRDENGKYVKQYALISQKYNVSIGYLDLTQENLLDVAFTCLGDRYGWGSMLQSYDCSGYVQAIYKCFGFILPRDTSTQQKIPGRVTDISEMTDDEKQKYFETIPVGSLLYFPGHTMMYVGSKDNLGYVISDTGNISDSFGDLNMLSMYTVILNPLTVRRSNGETWLSNLKAVVTFRRCRTI